jgi:AraC family transcriptional regulator
LSNAPAIRSVLGRLSLQGENEEMVSRLIARVDDFKILAELCRISAASPARAQGGLAPFVKRRSIELMHARLAEGITIDELAAEVRLSPFHFARMFKKSVGVPPCVYLTRLRVKKACELLAVTDLAVITIAQEVGYSSCQAFARTFHRHLHMTPTVFRRAVSDPTRLVSVGTVPISASAPAAASRLQRVSRQLT